jgi:hypothetical protein
MCKATTVAVRILTGTTITLLRGMLIRTPASLVMGGTSFHPRPPTITATVIRRLITTTISALWLLILLPASKTTILKATSLSAMKIALYVAALCSMILFNSPVLATCVQRDLNRSGVSSGPGAHLYRGPRSLSCDPSLHSPGQYASPSGPRAHPYRDSRAVSCRLSLRSPDQYTSPSGPGAHLYQGPRSLSCDPSRIKNR